MCCNTNTINGNTIVNYGSNSMTKSDIHKEMCDELNRLYREKNTAYGDSFGETYRKLGIISAVTRISDKYNRLVNLALNPNLEVNDEPIIDTLKDLANYSLMTIMELTPSTELKHGENNV